MAEEFIGLRVLVRLFDGQSVEGVIEAVSTEANILLLSDAVLQSNMDRQTMRFPRLEVTSDQIDGIEILSDVSPPPPSRLSPVPSPTAADPLTTKATKSKEKRSPNPSPLKKLRNSTPKKGAISEWVDDDVKRYKQEEFDFQRHLGLFDKKKIFNEIREQDLTRPEDRLIAHNLSQRKLRHDQNVLGGDRVREEAGEDEIILGAASTSSLRGRDEITSKALSTSLRGRDEIILGTASMSLNDKKPPSRIKIGCIDSSLLHSIEQDLLTCGSLSNEQMIENGGRSLCSFLFEREYDVMKRAKSQDGLLLVLSADRLGAYALCAGRHLLNRGINVLALPPSEMRLAPSYFNAAFRQFQKFGGEIWDGKKRHFSLVITSTLGHVPGVMNSPIYSLVFNPDAVWNIGFGLQSEVPSGYPFVICDVGWTCSVVNARLRDKEDYSTVFGFSSYVTICDKQS